MAQGGRPVGRHFRHQSRPDIKLPNHEKGNAVQAKESISLADDETIAFVRRTLCPKSSGEPLEELLPPLTSDNAIDFELYAIIAIILGQFVQSWYSRITSDTDFVSEIVLIIAHCTRGIEERLRHVDIESLLLDELPSVIRAHISAVQIAYDSSQEQYEDHARSARIAAIYHSLRYHTALSPLPIDDATTLAERENESDWCQLLVSRIMPLVLPPEDLLNPCLNALVSEIFSEMIVRNAVLEKSTQPWLLWESVTKVIYRLRPGIQPRRESPASSINRLDQYGLLAAAEQHTSGKSSSTVRSAINDVNAGFWSLLQYTLLAWNVLRKFTMALMQATSRPPRPRRYSGKTAASNIHTSSTDYEPRPIVAMELWSCLGQLTRLAGRMPWLTGTLALLQWQSIHGPGQLCGSNSALDRLMSAQIQERLLSPALLPPVLHAIRSAVFPDQALGPARIPPTSEEVVQIKGECTRAIVRIIPEPARRLYFATLDEDDMRRDVERTLDLFADAYINKHLMVAALELIVIRLFPELAEPDITP